MCAVVTTLRFNFYSTRKRDRSLKRSAKTDSLTTSISSGEHDSRNTTTEQCSVAQQKYYKQAGGKGKNKSFSKLQFEQQRICFETFIQSFYKLEELFHFTKNKLKSNQLYI